MVKTKNKPKNKSPRTDITSVLMGFFSFLEPLRFGLIPFAYDDPVFSLNQKASKMLRGSIKLLIALPGLGAIFTFALPIHEIILEAK